MSADHRPRCPWGTRPRVTCRTCLKSVAPQGMADHMRDKHGALEGAAASHPQAVRQARAGMARRAHLYHYVPHVDSASDDADNYPDTVDNFFDLLDDNC